MADAAFGFVVHTGWSQLVAVALVEGAPVVVHRARLALWDPPDPEAAQAYHRAAELPVARAEASLDADRRTAAEVTARSLHEVVAALAARDCRPVAARVVDKPRRALPALEVILAAHPMLHAAEGAMFRTIVAAEAGAIVPDVATVDPARLPALARTATGRTPARVVAALAAAGKAAGPPWTQEHKDCALAAWIALADRGDS